MLLNAGIVAASAGSGAWTPADISPLLFLEADNNSTLFDATSGGSNVAEDGIVRRWEDKGSEGNNATQRSGNPIWTSGGVSFGGNSDLAAVALNPATPYAAAIFTTNTQSTQRIISQGQLTTSTNVWELFLGNPGKASFRLNNNNSFRVDSTTSYATNGSKIMIVAFVADGLIRIRYNGIQEATASAPATQNTNSASTFIGGGDNQLNGSIRRAIAGTALSIADAEKLEGYLAHAEEMIDVLPSDHPYKTVAP